MYGPSKIARNQAIRYFNSIGLKHILFSPVGTDAFTFNEAGIPASGVLTGQDCCKTQHEVNLFGGYTGNYEGNIPSTDGGCVDNPFRWCDNLGNNNPAVMTFMSQRVRQDGDPHGRRPVRLASQQGTGRRPTCGRGGAARAPGRRR